MSITHCPTCHVKHRWSWTEAFDKFGFDDGDGLVMTSVVVKALRKAGYAVAAAPWGWHNITITTIRRKGVEQKPPARLYAIDDIVCWPDHLYGPAPEYFTRHRYVWAVWTPDHRGPSAFWWLSAADFRGLRSVHNINERKQP